MTIVLFDTPERVHLYPFTEIRPVAHLRLGMLQLHEWWARELQLPVTVLVPGYLAGMYPMEADSQDYLYLDARLLPDESLLQQLKQLNAGEALVDEERLLAGRTTRRLPFGFSLADFEPVKKLSCDFPLRVLEHPFQLVQFNGEAIQQQFRLLTSGRTSQPIDRSNYVVQPEAIFIEEGAEVKACMLNASSGPIYIGKNSLIMEGTMIRGAFAALEHSVVKMGSRIYGATTIGRYCTAGGEIKNTLFFDFSNKAHDGYAGDAVIGSWCNWGAGTSCSNIKNTAGEVQLWNKYTHQWKPAGNKCGVLMGDYTRTAINTSLNTGTVTGICCNIFNHGFVPKYIDDFTWNTATGETYIFEKMLRDLRNWMQLKSRQLSLEEEAVLNYLHSKQSQIVSS